MPVIVVGIYIGTSSSYIVVTRQGGFKAVADEYIHRNIPSCIFFSDQTRFIGCEARQQPVTNLKTNLCQFGDFIKKSFNDVVVQSEFKRVPYKVAHISDTREELEVSYLGETQIFVIDVVINAPTYSTDSEKRAILDATQISNLICVRIINFATAIALAYEIYNSTLPKFYTKSKTVVFIDVGYIFQSNVVAFDKGKMKVFFTFYFIFIYEAKQRKQYVI